MEGLCGAFRAPLTGRRRVDVGARGDSGGRAAAAVYFSPCLKRCKTRVRGAWPGGRTGSRSPSRCRHCPSRSATPAAVSDTDAAANIPVVGKNLLGSARGFDSLKISTAFSCGPRLKKTEPGRTAALLHPRGW